MPLAFEHPVGAQADTKELEYVAALLQTGKRIRSDATVQTEDVVIYLRSRHGIDVNQRYIEEHLFPELGGSPHGPTNFMDLCQVVGIILIPYFLRKDCPDERTHVDRFVFGKSLEAILTDAFGSHKYVEGVEDKSIKLTKELMRNILETYGETDVPEKVLEEMVEAVGGEGTVLDADTFLRAMVSDVQLYDLSWQESFTTHYKDVIGDKRTVDFWCKSATKKVSRTVVESGTTVGKTVVNSGKTLGNTVIKSGKSVVEGGIERVEHAFFRNGAVEGLSEPVEVQPEKPFEIELSPGNIEDKGHDETVGDERFVDFYTAPAIDYTAESYRSQAFFIAIWVAFVGTYFAYFFRRTINFGRLNCETWDTDEDSWDVLASFFCKVANSVVSWIIIFMQLSVFGFLFIFLGSFGVTAGSSVGSLLIGIATVGMFTVVAYFYELNSRFYSTVKRPGWGALYMISLLLGLFVLALQFMLLLRTILPKTYSTWFRNVTVALTNGMVRKETRTKKATVFKINQLVDNAMDHHQEPVVGLEGSDAGSKTVGAIGKSTIFLNATGRALLNYQAQEPKKEMSGGIWWAWKRMIQKSILVEEGIWLHGRLVASNCFQIIVAFVVFFALYYALHTTTVNSPDDDAASNSYSPKPWHFKLSYIVGAFSGFTAAMSVAIVYIPSFISTTLKFRYGVIPSLGNSSFQQYREGVDLVAMMLGSMIWGCIVTAVLCMIVFGTITFLFAYQVTRPWAAWVTAQLIGISVTLGIKVICLMYLRKRFHSGFYRVQVAPSNFLGLVLDCWYLGLSSGYMLVRSIILVFVSALYVGRIDTPVLAEGVGNVGPIILDSYPVSFRKDILLHEAHRHPYIERLGTMYLMKVRYGDDFSTRAGAMWRILFVLSLFPWLRKHRFPQYPGIPEELDFASSLLPEGRNVVEDFDSVERESTNNVEEENECMSGYDRVDSMVSEQEVQQLPPQSSNVEVPFAIQESDMVKNHVTFPEHSNGDTYRRRPNRRVSLADLQVQGSATQNREMLLSLENEALKQQNRRLLEQVQGMRRESVQIQFAPHRPSFMRRRVSELQHS